MITSDLLDKSFKMISVKYRNSVACTDVLHPNCIFLLI